MAKFQSLKGFRDFYPEDMARRSYITNTWRRLAIQHGFLEYDGPPLESLDLYRAKSGDEIVTQLYAFKDKGERDVAMRPEMTPTVARMVAARWQTLPKPVRWFSIPQLFRYERPQSGRLREHIQFNADIFGDSSYRAESEILALLIRTFIAFGLRPSDVQIRISDRRILNRVLADLSIIGPQVTIAYSVLDKYDREPRADALARLIGAGVSESSAVRLTTLVDDLRSVKHENDFATRLGSDNPFIGTLYELQSMVDGAREWLTFDLAIVRGLDYYTGTVFEAFDTAGQFRAICGGGRYDGLLNALGNVDAAAVGFGWGDVVLSELLQNRNVLSIREPALDWIVSKHNAPMTDAWEIVKQLRELGFSAIAISASANPREHSGTGQTAARFLLQSYDDYSFFSELGGSTSFKHRNWRELVQLLAKKQAHAGRVLTAEEVRGIATDPKYRHRGMLETN